MLLKIKNIKINLTILLLSALFSNEYDKSYNNHFVKSSPNSTEFDHLLRSEYESNLMHELDILKEFSNSKLEYEHFLNLYYKQYEKENKKFINAIVEPDIFYISGYIGSSNIIIGKNNYSFGKTIGFHIDSPFAFKILNKTIVLGLKSSITSLPPSNSLNWDNFRSLNMSSTYSIKFCKRIYTLIGLGATQNSNNSSMKILPLASLDLAYELPWRPLNIPFDITICSSASWDLENVHIGFNILLCKPYQLKLDL